MTTTPDTRPVLFIDDEQHDQDVKVGKARYVKKPKPVLEVVRGGK